MLRALITGGEGFVGTHLKRLLEAEGQEVTTFDLKSSQNILSGQLERTLKELRPHYIYHLAAVASVPQSFEDPAETIRVNAEGSTKLLQAVRDLELTSKILLASSTEVYTPALDDTPLNENSIVIPRTPYGVAKLAMEYMGAVFANTYDMDVVITRTTNHTGPGQDGPYALTSFAKQIVAIERGQQTELKHGDLTSYKSYLDVRDVVRAYRLAIDLPPYIYNIASNQTYEMQSLLDRLVKNAKVPVKLSTDTSLIRPYAPDKTRYQTNSKLIEAGWQPEYTIERTLNDLLEYWRGQ